MAGSRVHHKAGLLLGLVLVGCSVSCSSDAGRLGNTDPLTTSCLYCTFFEGLQSQSSSSSIRWMLCLEDCACLTTCPLYISSIQFEWRRLRGCVLTRWSRCA